MIVLQETDSTISWLREQCNTYKLPSGFAVRAEYQTAGHGQASNKWESELGKNLLCSIYVEPKTITIDKQFYLSQIVSIAIVDTIQHLVKENVTVKWPNDIYINNNKVCGILIENSIIGNSWAYSIIGIGLNINQTEFLSDAPNPVSISQCSGTQHNIQAIAENIIECINTQLNEYSEQAVTSLKQRYMSLLYRKTGLHPYYLCETGETFLAEIADIAPTGHLILRHQDGTRSFHAFKEVRFL